MQSDDNVAYLFSSDQGATWTPELDYGKRRRGFEPVSAKEVWMTTTNKYDTITNKVYADVIVHTTDGGETWQEDSLTLNPQDMPQLDGRIITFFDKNHGWIAASNDLGTTIFRYEPQKQEVEEDITRNLPIYGRKYTLSPNPADNFLHASLMLGYPIRGIEIYDALGRKYSCDHEINASANEVDIDCSALRPGYYFLRMVYGPKLRRFTRPFLIQR